MKSVKCSLNQLSLCQQRACIQFGLYAKTLKKSLITVSLHEQKAQAEAIALAFTSCQFLQGMARLFEPFKI